MQLISHLGKEGKCSKEFSLKALLFTKNLLATVFTILFRFQLTNSVLIFFSDKLKSLL